MKKTYALANLLVILILIPWNYIANTAGINGNTARSLSDEYANLFTPAPYAFSIWGLIFLGLIAHGIFQVKRVFFDKKDDDFVTQIGPWLLIAVVGTGAWVWVWLSEYTGLSVLVMLLILISLIIIIGRLNMERWDAPLPIIFWVWWPVCLFSGWIAVATIANIAAWLAKTGWQGPFSEITWTAIMIGVATLVNLLMIYYRNMREFALVGAWALVAIAARHWGAISVLQWTALAGAFLLLTAAGIHGYRNRATSPLAKWRAGKR